ncbi:MAG TPA: helix-turn-helix domain-containing protein [Pseudonocardiaceae bacterium]|jgi:AcrR family transcriptional regulator|nr:helix-turn-helix domain-containing protein [Pseudonocardiaceae bacterium]
MRADARRNSQVLIDTARAVFVEKGPDAPLDEIAKRAGVGPGTLYRHFPNRDALIEAVYRDQVSELANEAVELLKSYPDEPIVALEQWMRAQVLFVGHQRGLGFRLKAMVDPNGETMTWCKGQLRGAAQLLLDAAVPAGVRADLQPYDLLRIGHGIGLATETGTAEDRERLTKIMLAGLRAQD